MKNTLLIFFLSLSLLITSGLFAQQDPDNVLYRYTMNTINPAFAGADGTTSFTFDFRSQWQGIDGAPRTQKFFASIPLNQRVGVGASVVNDQTFIEQQTAVFADFSYKLQLSSNLDLFLGLKAGGNFFSVNADGLQTFNAVVDPLLQNQSKFNPNVGLGFLLKHENYFVSLSTPRLLSTSRLDEIDGVVTEATDELHLFLSSGYDFTIANEWLFKPSFLVRYVQGAPLSLDLTAAFEYNKIVEFGIAYRTDVAISGLALFNIADWITAGYAYDNSLRSELSGIDSGTHEVLIIFRLPQN